MNVSDFLNGMLAGALIVHLFYTGMLLLMWPIKRGLSKLGGKKETTDN